MFSRQILNYRIQNIFFCQKRHRVKKKWAMNFKKISPTAFALSHFDTYHKPVYGDLWRSIRLALLSPEKHGALVNNFANSDETVLQLMQERSEDILSAVRNQMESPDLNLADSTVVDKTSVETKEHSENQVKSDDSENEDYWREFSEAEEMNRQNINIFMPVKKILSEKQEKRELEVHRNVYLSPQEQIADVVPDNELRFPSQLQLFMHDMGEIESFEQPSYHASQLTDYHLMDGSILLPVLALDLVPKCRVLILGETDGDATLTVLQTALPDHVTCVVEGFQSYQKVKSLLQQYIPSGHLKQNVKIVKRTDNISSNIKGLYDMVYINAPSFNDRYALNSDEYYMFRRANIEDRLDTYDQQILMLRAGIEKCKPGGCIVYTTSTLSPSQNDGTIVKTIQQLQEEESDMSLVIMETSQYRDLFKEHFHFYEASQFGQLVIPKITANFGPTYFCKLKRIT